MASFINWLAFYLTKTPDKYIQQDIFFAKELLQISKELIIDNHILHVLAVYLISYPHLLPHVRVKAHHYVNQTKQRIPEQLYLKSIAISKVSNIPIDI